MEFRVELPDFGKIADSEKARAKASITSAMREATAGLKTDLRQQVVAAGLGVRLANTWRGNTYPESRDSLTPAGYVSSNAELVIGALTQGPTIRPVNGAKYLWIPTENVPAARRRQLRGGKVVRGGKMTPEEVENQFNGDFEIRPGRAGTLLAFINVIAAKNGRGFRGRTKGRLSQGRNAKPVLMFVLRRSVTLPKLLAPDAVAQKWAGRLPGLVASRWRTG